MASLPEIELACCAKFGLTPKQIREGRLLYARNARMAAMYIMRTVTTASLIRIGNYFDRDHTTVISAVRSTRQRMETDPALAASVAEIIAGLPSRESMMEESRQWAEKLKEGVVSWEVQPVPPKPVEPPVVVYTDPLAIRLAQVRERA